MNDFLNFIFEMLKNQFVFGLTIGLTVALFAWLKGIMKVRENRSELAKLREHLHTKMEIDAEGHRTRNDELNKLKRENENLRISIKTLQHKPGRAELRLLNVYDKAIHNMLAKAPGFAATWEMVMQEAEVEVEQTETGVKALVRKVFTPPRLTQGNDTSDFEDKE